MTSLVRYSCPVCETFTTRSIKSILWHIEKDHLNEPYSIRCFMDNCPKQYKNVRSLKTHIRRKHSQLEITQEVTHIDNGDDSIQTIDNNPEEMDTETATSSEEVLKRTGALFILKMREVHCLPQSTIDSMLSDTVQMCSSVVDDLKKKIKNKIQSEVPELDTILVEDLCDPFAEINTLYKQTKYFKEEFNLQVRSTML